MFICICILSLKCTRMLHKIGVGIVTIQGPKLIFGLSWASITSEGCWAHLRINFASDATRKDAWEFFESPHVSHDISMIWWQDPVKTIWITTTSYHQCQLVVGLYSVTKPAYREHYCGEKIENSPRLVRNPGISFSESSFSLSSSNAFNKTSSPLCSICQYGELM